MFWVPKAGGLEGFEPNVFDGLLPHLGARLPRGVLPVRVHARHERALARAQPRRALPQARRHALHDVRRKQIAAVARDTSRVVSHVPHGH